MVGTSAAPFSSPNLWVPSVALLGGGEQEEFGDPRLCWEPSSLLPADIALRCWGMKGIATEIAALSPGAGTAAAPSVTSSCRPLSDGHLSCQGTCMP